MGKVDTQEPTGARLTDAQVAEFARLTAEPVPTWEVLRTDVRKLEVYALDMRVGMSLVLADRAALVADREYARSRHMAAEAEIARLQAEVKRLDDYRAMWELRFGHTEDY